MTKQEDFTDDDWDTVRNTPWVVAIAIVAADPSGAIATNREFSALRQLVAAMDDHGSSNELIRAVAGDFTAERDEDEPDPIGMLSEHHSLQEGALGHCRSVVAILDRVAEPAESAEFRAWLRDLASAGAETSQEGGFMCIGGTHVSDREQTALTELADALGVTL